LLQIEAPRHRVRPAEVTGCRSNSARPPSTGGKITLIGGLSGGA
jgi:hypothetical protein